MIIYWLVELSALLPSFYVSFSPSFLNPGVESTAININLNLIIWLFSISSDDVDLDCSADVSCADCIKICKGNEEISPDNMKMILGPPLLHTSSWDADVTASKVPFSLKNFPPMKTR